MACYIGTPIFSGVNMDLFEQTGQNSLNAPLAERMRPQTLADVVGQHHLLGPGKLLRQ